MRINPTFFSTRADRNNQEPCVELATLGSGVIRSRSRISGKDSYRKNLPADSTAAELTIVQLRTMDAQIALSRRALSAEDCPRMGEAELFDVAASLAEVLLAVAC